jgi:hypothetical protein
VLSLEKYLLGFNLLTEQVSGNGKKIFEKGVDLSRGTLLR